MAKMIGVFTQIKGKIGNLIYSTWHGVQVIKTMFIPENPQSAGQTEHRDIFTLLIAFGIIIKVDIIQEIWDPYARGPQTGWSNWLQSNLREQTGSSLVYQDLCFSKGSILDTGVEDATYNAGTGVANIVWNPDLMSNQTADDLAGAVVVDDTTNKLYYNCDYSDVRSDGEIDIVCDLGLTPGDLHGFLFFHRRQDDVDPAVSRCGTCVCSAP